MRVQCCGAHYVIQPVLAEWAGIGALPCLKVSSSVMFEDTNKKICQERREYNTGSVYAPVKDHTPH